MSSLNFDPYKNRYSSRRSVTYGTRGMVATSQPLAAQAGLDILKKGGNAVDAAIATAAALVVVEPTGCGLGSDSFALIWKDGKLQGLNSSGYSPSNFSEKNFESEFFPYGWNSVTVPGVVAGWAELARKMGRLHFSDTLAPAIDLASRGFAVTPVIAQLWDKAFNKYKDFKSPEFNSWLKTFCPSGRAPKAGEIFRSQPLARTLRRIAEAGGEDFYKGDLAEKIITFSNKTNGFFKPEDLSNFKPEWVQPISINYRDFDIWELPPNGQGLCVLIALNILKKFDFEKDSRDDFSTYHKQIEAIKLAFSDAKKYISDPKFNDIPVEHLLSDDYASELASKINSETAQNFDTSNEKFSGGTVYLTAADSGGCMVSYIQSNYMGFGSGVVIPETGISLNNRGACFSKNPESPNFIAARKRPYNTIIPAFITQNNKPLCSLGVMGGFMQPQGQLQVIMNLIDFGMNPQEALDAPRWKWNHDLEVSIENNFPEEQSQKLSDLNHEIIHENSSLDFGRGEIILKTEYNSLAGASEPRADGQVAAW